MTSVSQLIAELNTIRIEHGDLPVYAFEESGAYPCGINVCLVPSPDPYDDWQFPHVQINP